MKNKVIVIVPLSLLIGLVFSYLFSWWWNPKLIEPNISRDELEDIELPAQEEKSATYDIFYRLNPDLKWKVPINLELCTRGDTRHVSDGMGYTTRVVIMNLGDKCIWKEYGAIEGSESISICSMPKREKQVYVFQRVSDLFHTQLSKIRKSGYCIGFPLF